MTQTARVTSRNGEYVTVELSRTSSCEACHKGADGCKACMFLGNDTVRAVARDRLCAEIGDTVLVSASSKRIVGYAAAVFALPIVVAFVVYVFLSASLGTLATALAVLAFVAVFTIACFMLDRIVRKKPDLEISEIVKHEHDDEENIKENDCNADKRMQ